MLDNWVKEHLIGFQTVEFKYKVAQKGNTVKYLYLDTFQYCNRKQQFHEKGVANVIVLTVQKNTNKQLSTLI